MSKIWLPYRVVPRGRSWAVYYYERWKNGENCGESGNKIAEFFNREKAQKMAYQLNGKWIDENLTKETESYETQQKYLLAGETNM